MSPRYSLLLGVVLLGCQRESAPPASTGLAVPAMAPRHIDLHGDPLPACAIARLGTVRLRHNSEITSLSYSPDGKVIASGCHDGLVHLWDVMTGKEIAQFGERGTGDPFLFGDASVVVFSPDGKTIATTARHGMKLWEVATGKCRPLGDEEASLSLAYSPDGTLLGEKTNRRGLRIWDVATGKRVCRIEDGQDGIGPPAYSPAFSPDNKLVASAGEDSILRIWEARTGVFVREFKGHGDRIAAAAFLPNGKSLLSASWDGTLRSWDVATGQERRRFQGHHGRVYSLTLAADGKMALSGGLDGTIRLWELNSGREVRRFSGWAHNDLPVALAPDGKSLATMGKGSCIQFWEIASGEDITPCKSAPFHIGAVCFSPKGDTLISRSWWGGGPRLWNTHTGRERQRPRDLPSHLTCLALSPTGEMLTTNEGCAPEGWDARIHYRELLTGRYAGSFKGRPDVVDRAIFSPDREHLALVGGDQIVRLWHRKKECVIRRFGEQRAEPSDWWLDSVQFTPDGSVLIVRRTRRFYLVCGMDPKPPTEMYFWDVATGRELSRFESFKEWCEWITFSPAGKLAATNGHGSDYWFNVWDTTTGQQLLQLGANRTRIHTAEFSPDGRIIATGHGDGSICLWESDTGAVRRRWRGHTGGVYWVAFSGDGLLLASSSGDGTGLIWDVSGRLHEGGIRLHSLTSQQCEECWLELGDTNAEQAYVAMWELATAPRQAVALLRERLSFVTARQCDRWIAELDDDRYAVREKASQQLEHAGAILEPVLRRVAAKKPSPEVRRRVEDLLKSWETPQGQAFHRRAIRAVECLEHVGSTESHELLRLLAQGPSESRVTREADGALRRLSQRRLRDLAMIRARE